MTALALDVHELSWDEVSSVAGGGIDLPVPDLGWPANGQPFPTGTGPYGGDNEPTIPN
ncbi:hypothetical protein [uncultured Brevundimonas sp.]|uniref:hypothetical protein n=1 Tax=uncultured Brevundimonas sp. TaxID=213418 RepID=UPI0030EF8DAB|tara:strand:+ start:3771 stop:3944 length:174 start_codon:yes stop_codon:yes gene_type:complete